MKSLNKCLSCRFEYGACNGTPVHGSGYDKEVVVSCGKWELRRWKDAFETICKQDDRLATIKRRLSNYPEFCDYYFDLKMGKFHIDLFTNYVLKERPNWKAEEGRYMYPKLLIQAPAAHAKSTYGGILYPIFRLMSNPKWRIILTANTLERSSDLLRSISYNLENNDKLIEDWRILHGVAEIKPYMPEKWTDSIIYINGADPTGPPSIRTTAVEARIAGKRGDELIGDDIVDDRNSATELRRRKTKMWFNTMALTRLEPWGIARLYATEYGEFTLYQDIIQHRSGQYKNWHSVIYRAIDSKNGGKDGVLWPEHWPYEALMAKKNDIHTIAFELAFQNNPKAREMAIFKENDLQYYETPPKGLKVYMGIDLAISLKETANYFVILVLGIDPVTQDMYVLDILRKHLKFSDPKSGEGQVEKILEWNAKWMPLGIGIGNKSYQEAMPQHLSNISAMPINRIDESTPKKDRMISLAYYFQNHKVYVRATMTEFVEEYLTYDPDNRDKSPDQLDALDFAIHTGLQNINRKYLADIGSNERKPIWMA